jgi:2-phosphoglycolate phosphatase
LKLVLFDLDGTLADTFKDLFWALNQALEEHGYKHADAAAIRDRVSLGARAMACAALPAASNKLDSVQQRFLTLYEQNLATRTTLFEGMDQVLTSLDDADIAYGVVTNKPARFSEPLLDQLRVRSRLCCLVSGDTTARAKPHPDPLMFAARLCAVPATQCVYIGDAHNDVIAAHAACMRAVVATYGYLSADDDPRSWNADALVCEPSQLSAWLLHPREPARQDEKYSAGPSSDPSGNASDDSD